MCAESLSGRRSLGSTKRRAPVGRHRLSIGALRPVEDAAGGWSLLPVTPSTPYVGRVGALAVALGVGMVVAGMPAVAAADTGSAGSAVDSAKAQGQSGPGSSTGANRKPRTSGRAGATESAAGSADATGSGGAVVSARSARDAVVSGETRLLSN